MNGDTFSVKAPKECSKKFAATVKGKFLTRGNVHIVLRITIQATSYRSAEALSRKNAEKVLWKVPAPNGMPRKVPKKCFGLRASLLALQRREARSTFSALSSAPHLGPALSEALFRHFSCSGFSTSVAGRLDSSPVRVWGASIERMSPLKLL